MSQQQKQRPLAAAPPRPPRAVHRPSSSSSAGMSRSSVVELRSSRAQTSGLMAMNEDLTEPVVRPASMVISRVSDQRPHLTSRSSESDLVTFSSRSRTESLLTRVDFGSGVASLTPYRQFYTSLRFEAGKLRGLDQRLAKEFEDDMFRTIEEEIEIDSPTPMQEISSSPIREVRECVSHEAPISYTICHLPNPELNKTPLIPALTRLATRHAHRSQARLEAHHHPPSWTQIHLPHL